MSNIISIDDFTSYMHKDVVLPVAQQVVDAINTYIERRTGRCFGEAKTYTERHDWNRVIYLRHQDVTAITSIRAGYPGASQATLQPSSYYNNGLGRVTLYGNPYVFASPNRAYNDYLEITYTAGTSEVPEDLKLAALGVAAGFYNWASEGNKDIVETQVGSYRVSYAGARGSDATGGSADANWSVINSYATKRF